MYGIINMNWVFSYLTLHPKFLSFWIAISNQLKPI